MAISEERKPQHYKKKANKSAFAFRRTTAIVSAVALIGSAMLIITSCNSNTKSSSEVDMTYTTKVETTATTTEAPEPVLTLLPGAQDRININADSAGWIKIDSIMDEEVMQKPNDTELGNSYYIDHSISGNKSEAGVVFADYRNILNGNKTSDNIILYGHNQKDNTKFGALDSYKWSMNGTNPGLGYYKNHALINFNTNYLERQYKIIAVFLTNTLPEHDNGNVFDYINYIDLSDEARYNDFITNVMKRSYIDTGIDVKHGDKFLTLSTCGTEFEGSRTVVVARQVRDGESADIDYTKCQLNSDFELPAIFH